MILKVEKEINKTPDNYETDYQTQIFMPLYYTKQANQQLENYERKVYGGENAQKIYELLNKEISIEDVLWYQAFEGFSFLINPINKNKIISSNIRRLIFKKFLNDTISEKDFSNPDTIKKMIEIMQNCYKNKKLTEDSTAYKIYTNPQSMQQILNGKVERQTVIRLLFALGLTRSESDEFLKSIFMRELSSAVPEELIVIWAMEKEIKDWSVVMRLKEIAADYNKTLKKFSQNQCNIPPNNSYNNLYTPQVSFDNLQNMSEENFIENFLKPCCIKAAEKIDRDDKQYSATSLKFMQDNSILKEVEDGNAGNFLVGQTIFLASTIIRYGNEFPISKYSFENMEIDGRKVMSVNMYVRFLNYCIMEAKKADGEHTSKIFSMQKGYLPKEIAINFLKYSAMLKLPKLPHRIDRNIILITAFYSFLLKRWSNKNISFLAKSPQDAHNLWIIFYKYVKPILRRTGHKEISMTYPLDTLLRIAFHSLSPLECYTRIYWLNVLSSFAEEKNPAKRKYPPVEKIIDTLKNLETSYEKLFKLKIIDEESKNRLQEFIDKFKGKFKS